MAPRRDARKALACEARQVVETMTTAATCGIDEYESFGHVWTAGARRRRGIAIHPLAEARVHFGYRTIEGPVTGAGAALMHSLTPRGE
jgi:hypothetical protein